MSSPEILLIDDDRRLADMVGHTIWGRPALPCSIRERRGKVWRRWDSRFPGWCCWT